MDVRINLNLSLSFEEAGPLRLTQTVIIILVTSNCRSLENAIHVLVIVAMLGCQD